MGIGYKLKKLIEKRNTNVNALANRVNVKPTTLYSIIERDNTKVDIDVLIAIAKVLAVPVEYFSDNYVPADSYYSNPETARLAEEAANDPDMRLLLDAKRDLSPEDLQYVISLIKHLKNKNS